MKIKLKTIIENDSRISRLINACIHCGKPDCKGDCEAFKRKKSEWEERDKTKYQRMFEVAANKLGKEKSLEILNNLFK